jgi:hypothetical protein
MMLERHIRDHHRQQRNEEPFQAMSPVPPSRLAAALGESALVEFIQLDGRLTAVTVVAGRIRLWRLRPLAHIRDHIDRVPFALHRLSRRNVNRASQEAAVTMLRHAAQHIDEALFGPLAGEIGDRPLVLIPTGVLQSLPWSILPSCAGRPVTVSPSAALWCTGLRPRETGGHTVVASGPGLPGARSEAEAVAAIYRTTALVDAQANVGAVTAALDGADVAHLAAHGRLHFHNPLFSSLGFDDGPLTVYDLEALHRAPQLVVLAACDIGRPVVPAGDELLGLGAAFIVQGTRQIVASVTPVPDAQATPLMIAFHRALAAGNSASVALAESQRQLASEDTVAMATAAAFVCVGAEYSLPPTLTRSTSPRRPVWASEPGLEPGDLTGPRGRGP